ncbi:hypothetical protein BKA70DRAFT_1241920 [Coprinopsis sp. MPI-PUGE-AT-0042]|nr:hypothetical protein BKA70DRAFT_1241920 [Coprinopsis sp. MPI-PUGE-AT-0042]
MLSGGPRLSAKGRVDVSKHSAKEARRRLAEKGAATVMANNWSVPAARDKLETLAYVSLATFECLKNGAEFFGLQHDAIHSTTTRMERTTTRVRVRDSAGTRDPRDTVGDDVWATFSLLPSTLCSASAQDDFDPEIDDGDIDEIEKLVDSHITVHPFVPKLLPGLIEVESAMADPEAHAIVDRVIKTLCKVGRVPTESNRTNLHPLKKADEELSHSLITIYKKHSVEVSPSNVDVMCTSNLIKPRKADFSLLPPPTEPTTQSALPPLINTSHYAGSTLDNSAPKTRTQTTINSASESRYHQRHPHRQFARAIHTSIVPLSTANDDSASYCRVDRTIDVPIYARILVLVWRCSSILLWFRQQVPAESNGADLNPLKKADGKELPPPLIATHKTHGVEVSPGNGDVIEDTFSEGYSSTEIKDVLQPSVGALKRRASAPQSIGRQDCRRVVIMQMNTIGQLNTAASSSSSSSSSSWSPTAVSSLTSSLASRRGLGGLALITSPDAELVDVARVPPTSAPHHTATPSYEFRWETLATAIDGDGERVGQKRKPVPPDGVLKPSNATIITFFFDASLHLIICRYLLLDVIRRLHATAGPLPPPPRATFASMALSTPPPPRPPRLHSPGLPLPSAASAVGATRPSRVTDTTSSAATRADLEKVKQALQLPPSIAARAAKLATRSSASDIAAASSTPSQGTGKEKPKVVLPEVQPLNVVNKLQREGSTGTPKISPSSVAHNQLVKSAPLQMARLMPEIVPVLAEAIWGTKADVKKAARDSLTKATALVSDKGIECFIPALIKALINPFEEVPNTINLFRFGHPLHLVIGYVAQHALHNINMHLDKTALEYILWRCQTGEDLEELGKANRAISEEEKMKMKDGAVIVIEGQKRLIDEIIARKKLKQPYKYEVTLKGILVRREIEKHFADFGLDPKSRPSSVLPHGVAPTSSAWMSLPIASIVNHSLPSSHSIAFAISKLNGAPIRIALLPTYSFFPAGFFLRISRLLHRYRTISIAKSTITTAAKSRQYPVPAYRQSKHLKTNIVLTNTYADTDGKQVQSTSNVTIDTFEMPERDLV